MRRVLVFIGAAVLALASHVALAQVTVRTISGNPLTINVGSDNSFQVYTSLVPGQGQFFPTGNTTVADYGVFVRRAGTLFAPAFDTRNTATSSIGTFTAWSSTSISNVSGSGTTGDPFTVTVVNNTGSAGLTTTMTVTYVNGENFFRKSIAIATSDGTPYDVFLGGDNYLASSDSGIPFTQSGAVGGQTCQPPTYSILMIPLTPADRYSARGYSTVWSEIGGGSLSNVIDTGCRDNGAALQWQNRTGATTIVAATSFGEIPPIVAPLPPASTEPIPTMSEWALILMAALIAMLGLRRVRKMGM